MAPFNKSAYGNVNDESTQNDFNSIFLYPALGGVTGGLTSLGAGAPTIVELGDASAVPELTGVGLTTADELYWFVPFAAIPYIDRTRDIRAAALVAGGAGSTAVQLALAVKGIAVGQLFTDAKVSPDASIQWPDLTCVADTLNATEPKGLGLAENVFGSDRGFMVAFTCVSDGGGAADVTKLIGVELIFTARFGSLDGIRKLT